MSPTVPPTTRASVVVAAPEDLDLATAPALRAALRECVEAGYPNIRVDMSDVTFLDCSGVSAVVVAYKEAALRGLTLLVVRPSPPARKVLELACLTLLVEDGPRAPTTRRGRAGTR